MSSLEEDRLVGTWDRAGIGRTVFRRDHTFVQLVRVEEGGRWLPGSYGTWRIEGNEIVTDETVLPIPGFSPFPNEVRRMSFREIGEHRLVREEGRRDLTRVAFGREHYAQIRALLAVVVSLAALGWCIYTAQLSASWKPFLLLSIAAGLALLWALALLITELAQTGAVVLPIGTMHRIGSGRAVLIAACVAMSILGFWSLYAARQRVER